MSKPYPEAKKIEVVTTFLALGKMPLVEAVTGVPRETIRKWRQEPWWIEIVNEIQNESEQELDSKLSKIIDRSLDAVNERIEHGEFILDAKTGKVVRVPVKLRDVEKVAVDLLDKRDLIRGRPEKQKQSELQTDILTKLAAQFTKWVQANIKKETTDALYDQRPQGLQEGVQLVPQPEETKTQPSTEEQSSL